MIDTPELRRLAKEASDAEGLVWTVSEVVEPRQPRRREAKTDDGYLLRDVMASNPGSGRYVG